MSDPEELDALIADYLAGELDHEGGQRLLTRIESDPEVRRQLAEAVVTDRLLRGLGQGPVSHKAILQAVQAERLRGVRATTGKERSPFLAIALLLVIVALGALLLVNPFKHRDGTPPPEVPPVVKPVSPPEPPEPAPPSPAVTNAVTTPHAPPSPPRPSLYQPFPLDPPPRVEVLPPPDGDGSREAGFVAPPAAWAASEPPVERADPGKPAPPLLWVKLQRGSPDHWNAAPGDVQGLMAEIRARLDLDFGVAVRSLAELDPDPAANPLLFLSSHFHFVFTPEERARLRRFMLNGGMVVFNAGLGSQPARDSARRELAEIFPELTLQRLGTDHPLYHAYHDLQLEADAALEGLSLSCRTVAVLSPWGLSAGWAKLPHEAERAHEREQAVRIGLNLFTYATAIRAWAKRASQPVALTPGGESAASKLYMAQLVHQGDWRTRYTALPRLLQSFNRLTDVPVQVDVRAVSLSDPELFNHPLVYLTGHEALRLTPKDVEQLGRYLRNGGFLFAEACCGRSGFDRSFRRLMEHLFPDQPLVVVPQDSPLFKQPHSIGMLGVTQSLGARNQSMLMRPRLEGLKVGPNYAVIYSRFGLAGGWEMAQTPYADGYEDPDSLKLGQNILMYVITQ